MILITGATGFVGGHLVKRLRATGTALRAVVRNPEKAQALKDLGVDVVPGDMSDKASLVKAANGALRVVHLVGIIQEAPGATFKNVHVDGTANLLDAAQKTGVRQFVYQSALGTRPNARSAYHQSKWAAEELVRTSGIPFTILRPSLIYGEGDQFTIRLSSMIGLSPVLPVIGPGKAKIQPLFIDDVVACLVKSVTSDAFLNKMYELGGPEQLTYEEVTKAIAKTMGVNRPTLHLPLFFIKPMARAIETALMKPPITTDQLVMLLEDNVCGMSDIREAFGIEPIRFSEGLPRFIKKSV